MGERSPRDHRIEAITGSLTEFTTQLRGINGVEAVAFLTAEQPSCPVTLSVQIVAPLGSDADSRARFKAVVAADGQLARRIASTIPGELQFIDSTGQELDTLQEQLTARWNEDPNLTLVDFVRFR